ncbi:hypothetical protein FRC11_002346 [Ceratobasidium sp. 423]|nr:hypothetical protein FRC11_002346 [Ceratobasidium sp. 423]
MESHGLLDHKGPVTDDKLQTDAKYTLKYSSLPKCDCRIQRICDDTQLDNRLTGSTTSISNSRHSVADIIGPQSFGLQIKAMKDSRLSVVPCQIHNIAPRVASESQVLFKQRNDLMKRFEDLKLAVSNQVLEEDSIVLSVEEEIDRATWVRKVT